MIFPIGIPTEQIEDYVRSIQRNDYYNGKPPSIVLPILIYHGEEKWEHKRLYDVFSPYLPQIILDYVSFPKYLVIDLQALSDTDIEKAIGLGELRAAFIALKHAQDKNFFKQNLKEIFNLVEDSPPSLLFKTYYNMLVEYSQRRSGLEPVPFNKIVEQLKEENMATAFKSVLVYRDELAIKKGMALVEEGPLRNAVQLLIKTTNLTNAEIAENIGVKIDFVEGIRQEINAQIKPNSKPM